MATLYNPPSYLKIYAKCINDSLPKFKPNNWIKNGKFYNVKSFVEPLNLTEEMAVIITDSKNNEIHPNATYWSFNSNRFEFFNVFLN